MTCEDFRIAYDAWLDERAQFPEDLDHHRRTCEACREYSDDMEFHMFLIKTAGPSKQLHRRLDFYAQEYERFWKENPKWKEVVRVLMWTLPAIILSILPMVVPEDGGDLSISPSIVKLIMIFAAIFISGVTARRLKRIAFPPK